MAEGSDDVGPVLEASNAGRAVLSAIRAENPGVSVVDRGSYLRVLVPRRCVVSRAGIERELGREFRLPRDLESLMPSFKGLLAVTPDSVEWSFERQ
jgi:toluene monooxygenase system protein D